MDKTTGRITLKHIAQQTGVSVSTVSLVLRGKASQRRISSEVQQRVKDYAAAQDYSPNLLVRGVQQGRTHVLSLYNAFNPRDRGDYYVDQVSRAIERAAGARHYDLLVHCDFSRSEEETYRIVSGGLTDGLIFLGPPQENALLTLLRAARLPTVIFGHADELGALSSVTEDMESGMREMTDWIVKLGHRRVAALTDSSARTDAPARINAMKAHLAHHGLELPAHWVLPVEREEPQRLDGVLRFLLGAPKPPTALFCWHDRLGYRMLEACERVGIAVPEELSLLGYDGLQFPSTSPHVLASLRVDIETMAETTVQLLDALIRGESAAPVKRTFPVGLLCGTTVAPCRGAH